MLTDRLVPSTRGRRIVICDYNALLLSVTGLLRMSDYAVFQAHDGWAADHSTEDAAVGGDKWVWGKLAAITAQVTARSPSPYTTPVIRHNTSRRRTSAVSVPSYLSWRVGACILCNVISFKLEYGPEE